MENLQNDEYLFWGENQINSDYNFSAIGVLGDRFRINSEWRVSERGDVGTVGFTVKASDIVLTGIPSGILRLIRSTTSDFSTITETHDLTLAGGEYSGNVTFNDNDYFTLEIISIADLSVTKTVNLALPKVGQTIVFNLTVTNSGPAEATNILVRDLLPSNLTFDAANSSITTGTYNAVSGDWVIPSIPNGEFRNIQIAAKVNAAGKIINSCQVISLDQYDLDSNIIE